MSGHGLGRDDTRWGKVQRELAAEWAMVTYEAELAASADLNARYTGRWHIWFEAGADTLLWVARPMAGGEPRLSAPTAEGLAELIDQQ